MTKRTGNSSSRELVGSPVRLSTQTRIDISNAVRAVVRYCAAPTFIHWRATLGISWNVRTTSLFDRRFQRGTVAGLSMNTFADAIYASEAADTRSVSGGLVMCGGACVSWFSPGWTQNCVTLSTTQAEHVALADLMKEVLFPGQIWRFSLPGVVMPVIPVFQDNAGAVQLAQIPITSCNTSMCDYHFLRKLEGRKEISAIRVSSDFQHADFLTTQQSLKTLSNSTAMLRWIVYILAVTFCFMVEVYWFQGRREDFE